MSVSVADREHTTAGAPYRWRWLVLGTILCAEIMDLLDATIVNLAATPIERDLGGGASTVQWVVGAYTLAFAVALVLGGRLGDKYGRRNLFLVGAAGFTLASLACAIAQDAMFLIVARAAQGFLGALLIPQGFGIMKEVFPPHQLGKAFASFGPVIGLSAVGGPLLGGVLVDADLFGLGWRIVFFVNLPLGLAAVAGAFRFIPPSARNAQLRLDPLGVGLLAAASLLLVYPLIQGHDLDWPWWTFVLMASYLGGLAVIMLSFGAMIGFTLVFNVFAQAVLGFSPLRTAFAGCGYALGMSIAAGAGSGLVPRFGRAVLGIGFAVMILGVGLQALTVAWAGLGAHAWQFLPAGLVFGLGGGLAIVPIFSIILAGVADHEVGSASGVLNALQQLGGTIGVAVAGTLFFELLPDGPVRAMEITTIVAAGFLVGSLVLVRLLPRRPRMDQVHGS
jgi:MFS family permease